MNRAMLIACLIALGAACAQAQVANIDERVINIQAPPVMITNIHAGYQTPAWASEAHKKDLPKRETPFLPLYLQVQNTSPKTIYAYRVVVFTYDAFGDYLDTVRCSAVTALAPQVADYGRWSVPIKLPYLTWTLVAYLDAVRFQDGYVWRIDPESIAALVPSTAPGIRFQSWHIVPDPREILMQALKDPG